MDQWSTLYRTTPLLWPAWACLSMREMDATQMKAVREWVPDEKRSMGLLGKGTGNSSYGQTRGGVRWVSGNNQVREKNKSLYGRKTRRKTKRRLGLAWAWCWDRAIVESCEAKSQDQVGHRSSWNPMSDAGNKYANKTSMHQWQQRWKQGIMWWILYQFC